MTIHNEASVNEIAKIVVMPGDPLRAKYIADNYLEEAKQVNKIRNMFCYTGKYKGKEISVMAHGMGIPSVGIYAYELYKFYNVECIIRIGSCGGYSKDLEMLDTVLVDKAYTESNFAYTLNNEECKEAEACKEINEIIEKVAKDKNIAYKKGNIFSSDVFDYYMVDNKKVMDRLPQDTIAAEMEAFGLFYLAKMLNKKAACILTVVDLHYKEGQISAQERQTSLNKMIELGLESAINI
jgi:purine-nucleoside phosphorylase